MTLSLSDIIKREAEKKGRPLKIICDWDECLLSREAWGNYLYFTELTGKRPPFPEFFKEFWEKAEYEYSKGEEHLSFCIMSGIKEIDSTRSTKKHENWGEAGSWRVNQIMQGQKDFYETTSFLTFSKSLLEVLQYEDFISDLIIPQNYKANRKGFIASSQDDVVSCPRKRWKMRKTFAKFPQARNEINKPIILDNGQEKKFTRAQWTANNHPDFDIFIDDNPATLRELISAFPDKTFVVPYYAMNRHITGQNVYHIPVQPISLKDQDFTLGSLNYRLKKIEQKLNRFRPTRTNLITILIVLSGIIFISLLFVNTCFKKKKYVSSKNK